VIPRSERRGIGLGYLEPQAGQGAEGDPIGHGVLPAGERATDLPRMDAVRDEGAVDIPPLTIVE
jgi:hypothetical protein